MSAAVYSRHPLPTITYPVTLAKGKHAIPNRVVIPAKLWANSGLSGTTIVMVESTDGQLLIKRYEPQGASE